MTQEEIDNLGYRKGVIVIVVNRLGEFLLIQKSIYNKDQWDFPGGGIDEGETIQEATLRELKEELGTEKFTIVKVSPYEDKYDWPKETIESMYRDRGKTWRGQSRTPVIVEFYGNKEEIKLETPGAKKAWVSNHIWVQEKELYSYFKFDNQIPLINALKAEFQVGSIAQLIQ